MTRLANPYEFITGSSLTNMTWDQVSQWYTRLVDTDIKAYLENPNAYHIEKNDKHLGTICMFDPAFTSKFSLESTLSSQVGSVAINGTLGLDYNGRPCMWLKNNDSIGQLWAKPTDMGTECHYTKVVLLSAKPGFVDNKTHAFPVENIEEYNTLYFCEDLLR